MCNVIDRHDYSSDAKEEVGKRRGFLNGNGNGNAVWTRWTLGVFVTLVIFFGGFFAGGSESSETDTDKALAGRITSLEDEAHKGERWTLQDQMEYMGTHSESHEDLIILLTEQSVKIEMICKATKAGC